jgi:hypothetical protein
MQRMLIMLWCALLVGCSDRALPVVISDPCSDFCTIFEPSPPGSKVVSSPKLIRNDGQLLLEIPFTPAAGYEEVDRLVEAAKHGPAVARVKSTGREFIIQAPAWGSILVYVDSLEHAEAILRDLCFKGEYGDYTKLKLPP